MGVNVTVQGYQGRLDVGVSACAEIVPDIDELFAAREWFPSPGAAAEAAGRSAARTAYQHRGMPWESPEPVEEAARQPRPEGAGVRPQVAAGCHSRTEAAGRHTLRRPPREAAVALSAARNRGSPLGSRTPAAPS
jgi:hypothetical protein